MRNIMLGVVAGLAFAASSPALARAQVQQQGAEEPNPAMTYRITVANFKKFAAASRRLAAAERRNPGSVFAQPEGGDSVTAVARDAITGAGLTPTEWMSVFVAVFAAQTMAELGIGVENPDLPPAVRANMAFLGARAKELRALDPDLNTLTEAIRKATSEPDR